MDTSAHSTKRSCAGNAQAAPLRSRRGLTLVEVMVASVVLIMGIVGSLVAIKVGFEMLDTARNTTMADQILQSDLEDIRLCNWGRIEQMEADIKTNAANASIPLPAELDGRFDAERSITPVRADLKRIKVTVTWDDYKGRSHVRSYETFFTKLGLNDYFVTDRSGT